MPYSKKVLEAFKNPKHCGKIKNPDGIGKVGNKFCVPPDQVIHTDSGLRVINKIFAKDKVLSHNGLYQAVNGLVKRNYNGRVLVVKNKLGKTTLTEDHLILSMQIPKGDKFLRTKNRKNLIYGWHHATELKKGDIILYPIIKESRDLKHIKFDIPKPKWDFRSKEIPDKIALCSGLLRLFGYYLSEGNIQDKPCRTFIALSLNIAEKEIVEDIKRISRNLFNLKVTIRELPKTKTVVVFLYSARLARFFKKLFDNGAKNKNIPDFIMKLPPGKQRALIYGLWKGDGYVNIDREGARAGYSTISYQLAQQLKILLLRQKIVPSIYEEQEREVKGLIHRKAYRIHVGQRDSLVKLCSILKIKYNPQSYSSESSWFDESYLYTPITRIEKQNYDGQVYNLEVSGSHSFTSNALCLHNCGDVMWLYIKIGKNKKKQEIIKDIKFETFGCVAAIASSNIIAQMIKGKTIERALSLSKDHALEELGGLPPIKVHCSVLAVDALKEAIFNYLKNNNKEIPLELKKRHEVLEKERKEIENKYKDWVQKEEQTRNNEQKK